MAGDHNRADVVRLGASSRFLDEVRRFRCQVRLVIVEVDDDVDRIEVRRVVFIKLRRAVRRDRNARAVPAILVLGSRGRRGAEIPAQAGENAVRIVFLIDDGRKRGERAAELRIERFEIAVRNVEREPFRELEGKARDALIGEFPRLVVDDERARAARALGCSSAQVLP